MTMKYKIYKRHHHNEYGDIGNETFFIKKKKSFLGITYWKEITHTECFVCDCYKTTTEFKTYEEAKNFIQDVLCKDIPRQKWVETPINEMSCTSWDQ